MRAWRWAASRHHRSANAHSAVMPNLPIPMHAAASSAPNQQRLSSQVCLKTRLLKCVPDMLSVWGNSRDGSLKPCLSSARVLCNLAPQVPSNTGPQGSGGQTWPTCALQLGQGRCLLRCAILGIAMWMFTLIR